MLLLFIFSGGTFIRDGAVPDGWKWLKAMSPFEHAADAYLGEWEFTPFAHFVSLFERI
jgi:hypothetical protein